MIYINQILNKIKSISWIIYPTNIFILSFWSGKIFENNLFIFSISFILAGLLFLIYLKRYNRTFVNATFIVTSIIVILAIFPQHLDKTLWEKSFLDTTEINTRRSYYSSSVGAIFQNKYMKLLNKYESRLSPLLDINFYFFASHPRERVGIDEFEKYSPLFIPFFIIGLIQVVKNKFLLISTLSVLIVAPLIDLDYVLGPVLLFPLFTAILAIGEERIVNNARKFFQR